MYYINNCLIYFLIINNLNLYIVINLKNKSIKITTKIYLKI